MTKSQRRERKKAGKLLRKYGYFFVPMNLRERAISDRQWNAETRRLSRLVHGTHRRWTVEGKIAEFRARDDGMTQEERTTRLEELVENMGLAQR